MFCPRCGEEKNNSIGKICTDCYVEKEELVKVHSDFALNFCQYCGSIFTDSFTSQSLNKAIEKSIKDNLEVDSKFKNLKTGVEITDKTPEKIEAILNLEGFIGGKKVVKSLSLEIPWERGICKKCSISSRSYYEAVLQIRATDREIHEEEVKEILSEIHRFRDSRKKEIEKPFISKLSEEKGGFDIYLGDSKLGRELYNHIKKLYAAEFNKSASLAGLKDGKKIYKVTYLVRLPSFRKKDILRYKGKIYVVKSLGQRIELTNIQSSDKKFIEPKRLDEEEIDVIGRLKDIKETVITVIEKDYVQVLHPSTKKAFNLRRPNFLEKSDQGEKIPVLSTKDDLFIVKPSITPKKV